MSNPHPTIKFPKGVSGNPNGRPKREWTWAGLIEDAMEEEDETGIPYKKIIARKLRLLAKAGDITAIKEVMNRMDGMPTQPTDLTSKGEKLEGLVIVTKGDPNEK